MIQAADLEKDCNSFMFVIGVWGITLPSFCFRNRSVGRPSDFTFPVNFRSAGTKFHGESVVHGCSCHPCACVRVFERTCYANLVRGTRKSVSLSWSQMLC